MIKDFFIASNIRRTRGIFMKFLAFRKELKIKKNTQRIKYIYIYIYTYICICKGTPQFSVLRLLKSGTRSPRYIYIYMLGE